MSQKSVLKCPWCPCTFFTVHDLEKHLEAFRITGQKPNAYDHRVKWNIELERRKKEYGD